MGHGTRVAAAEAWLFPDVRIVSGRGAESDHARSCVAKVPGRAIQADAAGAGDLANHVTAFGQDLDTNRARGCGGQSERDRRLARLAEAICRTHLREGRGRRCRHRALFENGNVVEHIQAAAISGNHDVVEVLLGGDPGHGCRGQTSLKLGPMRAVVHRVVETMARARIEEALLCRALGHGADVGQRTLVGKITGDAGEGLAEVGGLVDVGLTVIHHVPRHRDIGGARVMMRGLDLADHAPRGHADGGERLGQVVPGGSAVPTVPDLAVVGAGPDKPLLDLGVRDREHDLAIELAEVVAHDAARGDNARRILGGEIRAQFLPRLAAVAGLENELAAVENVVGVEGIDGERRGPVAAVLRVVRR